MEETDLESGEEIACLLCRLERVKVRENRAGKPYLYCNTFESSVNLREVNTEDAQLVLDSVRDVDSPSESLENQLGQSGVASDEGPDGRSSQSDGTITMADVIEGSES